MKHRPLKVTRASPWLILAALLITGCTSVRTRLAKFEPCSKPGKQAICRNSDGTYSFRTPYDTYKENR